MIYYIHTHSHITPTHRCQVLYINMFTGELCIIVYWFNVRSLFNGILQGRRRAVVPVPKPSSRRRCTSSPVIEQHCAHVCRALIWGKMIISILSGKREWTKNNCGLQPAVFTQIAFNANCLRIVTPACNTRQHNMTIREGIETKKNKKKKTDFFDPALAVTHTVIMHMPLQYNRGYTALFSINEHDGGWGKHHHRHPIAIIGTSVVVVVNRKVSDAIGDTSLVIWSACYIITIVYITYYHNITMVFLRLVYYYRRVYRAQTVIIIVADVPDVY